MNNSVKQTITENLRRRYIINEDVKKISLMTDENEKMGQIFEYLGKLIDEGYDSDDIKDILSESWISDVIQQENPDNMSVGTSVTRAVKRGGFSQFREYAISMVLKALGFEGRMSKFIAIAMADINVVELVNVFRSSQGCQQYGKTVLDAITEGILRTMVTGTKQDSFASKLLGNVIGDYIRTSGIMNKVTPYLCSAIHSRGSKPLPVKKNDGINPNLPSITK
jgi:hypothetical protein